MLLPIFVYGNPVLRKAGVNIAKDYPGLAELISGMFETMKSSDGVGLAAPQIGKAIRLFIVDASPYEKEDPGVAGFHRAFINAKITERSGEEKLFNEGCLSLPGIREDISRKSVIKIEYSDENFEFHEDVFEGIKARIIQHEYDHIEGKLLIDHLSPVRRALLKARLDAISKGKVETAYKIKIARKQGKK